MTQTITDSRILAKKNLARGVLIYPVKPGEKGPKVRNWQLARLGEEDIDEMVGPGSNLIRHNGEPSGWQVDVDADTPEAAAAAKLLLPETPWVHGRPGNPESHYTFICKGIATTQFNHPVAEIDANGKKRKKMIVEIRSTKSGTIMPGSRHPDGDFYCYYRNGQPMGAEPPAEEPTVIDKAELLRRVEWIAAVGVLAPFWGEGSRNAMSLHLSGGLLHGGMEAEDVAEFIRVLCTVAGDEEVEKRVRTAQATAEKFAAGEEVTGFRSLGDFILEKAVLIQVGAWLGLTKERAASPKLSTGGPLVILSGDFADELEATVSNLLAANAPEPKYFNFNGELAVIETNPSPRIRTLNVDTAREVVADEMRFIKGSEDAEEPDFQHPHRELLSTLIKSSRISRFPAVSRLIHGPVMAKDGSLHTRPGYSPASEAYQCITGLESMDAAGEVSEGDVARAIALFNDGPFSGFVFDSPASRTHAFCGMIQPIVRAKISGPTPLILVEAPTRSSGKTMLTRFIAGVNAPNIQDSILPQDETEREKLVLSLLSGMPEAILLDNIAGYVNSPTLDKVLTSTEYTGRVLGRTGVVSVPNTALWLATGNNVSFFGDLLSRTLRIGLDTGMEKPEERSDYAVPDLDAWLEQHRIEALNALVTLVRYWQQKGMPLYRGNKKFRMAGWLKVMGGICEAVGLEGFLDNAEAMEEMDTDDQNWTRFFQEWHKEHSVKPVTSKDLIRIAFGKHAHLSNHEAAEMGLAEPGPLFSMEVDRKSPTGRVAMLTSILKKQRGRPFGGWKIVMETGGEAKLFRLETVKPLGRAI